MDIDFYTSSAFLGPACVFEPSDSYQMADAVLTFQNFSSPFAVRGGGHMPIADAANINSTGVLLSTAGLSQVQVSDDKKTVNVGPGNHWVDVYRGLEPYGLTVVGGRLGVVGVPGLLLGGGVSYFGNEYGWGSANIASFTVVLANGTVAVARADNEYSDLFWALRGGGNSFGIVTNFEMNTIEAPEVMIGLASYVNSEHTADDFIDAVHDYAVSGTKDHKSATIPTAEFIQALGTVFYSSFVFYNGKNESPASLKKFLGTKNGTSTNDQGLKTMTNSYSYRSMYKWSQELDPTFPLLKGDRQRFYVLNIHASNREAIAIVHDTYLDIAKSELPPGVLVAALAFPAVGEKYIEASTVNGGDPMSLDPEGAPYIWVEESITALSTVTDEQLDEFYDKANAEITKRLKERGIDIPAFLYLNDANPKQDVFATYPQENVQRLRRIRAKYDPERVYTDLMPGGWKVD